jgi:DNA helicase II / ATP-dependent DNA helicase PcrA
MNIRGTEQQLKIFKDNSQVKRVIACAGSGKTWVLTNHIVKVLKDGYCEPGQILALTFTKNAAENMRQRIKRLFGDYGSYSEIDIYTFNSFGNEIIYENSFEMGLGKDFRLITDSQSWQILYRVLREAKFENLKIGKNPGIFLQDVLEFIQNVKNNLITREDFEEYIRNYVKLLEPYKSRALKNEEIILTDLASELFSIYLEYEKIKSDENKIDYADQVFIPYSLFSRRKIIREKYRLKYKYIFIDEFQDTNVAQARFITMLYKRNHNRIMIVGDDDQAIYSFRGACVENILEFDRWDCFGKDNVKDFYLSVNFRSGQEIINAADAVISKNKKRFRKAFECYDDSKSSEVFFDISDTIEDEAESIAGYIRSIMNKTEIKPGKIAILGRRKRFDKIMKALKNENIRYELIGSKDLYYEPEILFITSWLKVIGDVYDELSIVYILKSDKYRIGDRDIFYIKNNKPGNNRVERLIDGISNCQNNNFLSDEAKRRLASFMKSLLFYIKQSGILDLKELISLIFEDSGLAMELKSGFGKHYQKKLKNVENLIKIASDFTSQYRLEGYRSFITYLEDIARTDYDNPDKMEISDYNSVKIMSIHAAKGLEFDAVIIPMLWESDYLGRNAGNSGFAIPSQLRKDNSIWAKKKDFKSAREFNKALRELRIEEERRIFYVACSRARRILLFSYSRFKNKIDMIDEKKSPKELVPFFKDLLVENIRTIKPLGNDAEKYIYNINGKNHINKDICQGTLSKNESIKKTSNSINLKKYDWKYFEEKLGLLSDMIDENRFTYFNDNLNKLYGTTIEDGIIKEAKRYFHNIKLDTVLKSNGQNIKSGKKIFPLSPVLDYLECPAMYKWKYVYCIPRKPDRKMEIGERVHKYIENIVFICSQNNSFKIKNFLDGCPYDAKPYIRSFIESRFADFHSYPPEEIMLEKLFYLKTGNYFITGKIDRVDIRKEIIEIIDYKLSDGTVKEIPLRYKRQILSYISAFSKIMDIPVDKIKGTIFYLGNGRSVSMWGNSEEIERNDKILLTNVKKIIDGKFASVKKAACNKNCDYLDLCIR